MGCQQSVRLLEQFISDVHCIRPPANGTASADATYEKKLLMYKAKASQVVEITYIFSPNHYGAIFEHTGLESLSPKGVEIARRMLTSVDIASVAAEEKLASELAEATSLEEAHRHTRDVKDKEV